MTDYHKIHSGGQKHFFLLNLVAGNVFDLQKEFHDNRNVSFFGK
jgi:hypothetical protein